VLTDLRLIAAFRGRVNVQNFEPPIEELADCRARTGVSLLVDLVQQPSADFLRLGTCMWPGRHDLDEIQPTLRDRVPPDMDADAERARWQLVDGAALPLSPPDRACCHRCTVAFRVMSGVTPRVR
jgi:hypothetical protein